MMRFPWLLIGCFFFVPARAQYKEVKRFTTSDGLPSNIVYNCLEDNQGFLWVGTPAGVARFDGKYFQNYTTHEGVPDNEVLQVVKENNNRLWISSYRQEAAYFDEVKNRFINAKQDTMLRAFTGTGFSMLSSMPDGGVRYYSQGRSVFFRNNQRNIYTAPKPYQGFLVLRTFSGNQQLGTSVKQVMLPGEGKINLQYLILLKDGKVIDSAAVYNKPCSNIQTNNEGLFMAINEGRKILHLKNFTLNPIRYEVDTIQLQKSTLYYHLGKKLVYANANDGSVDVYDMDQGQYKFSFKGDFVINSLYEDRYGDFWISTRNNGLLYYRKSQLQDVPLTHVSENHSIHSFSRTAQKDHFYVGLNDNSVVEYNEGRLNTYKLDSIKNPGIVHYLHQVGDKLYAFSEHAARRNFTHYFANSSEKKKMIYYKCTRLMQDSDLLLCGQGRLDWLDTRTDSLHINLLGFILNTCAAFNKNFVYSGSTDGLRIIRNLKDVEMPPLTDSILRERITDLCLSKDSTLWVATSQSGIYAYKQGRVSWKIDVHQGLIHDMINTIRVDARNQVWVGTNAGVSRITLRNNTSYVIQNITQLDGLASNDVNQFYEKEDTMYVVTSRGITLMPLTISLSTVDIPVVLQGVSVNQKVQNIQDHYNLPYNQNQISLQFSGVDITGHFKQLEYKLNEKDDWTLLDGNRLNLNLNCGLHQVLIRSVDVNGNRGTQILQLEFNVETPFWKSAWFWIITVSLSQIVLAYFLYRRIKNKQKEKLIRDRSRIELASLEQQAFTSLLNPHFIFNALNGLQDFINKADRQHTNRYLSKLSSLIRKSFELAQQSFISLEEELENLKQYLELEQQRHQPSFTFTMDVDSSIDPDNIMLPSMLLQPLIENALIHGKLAANPEGKLIIQIRNHPDGVSYSISDNGIGMNHSAQTVQKNSRHKSRGLQLLQKRLDALGELCGQEIRFQYSIPFPHLEKPGHEVKFTLPHSLYGVWQKSRKQPAN